MVCAPSSCRRDLEMRTHTDTALAPITALPLCVRSASVSRSRFLTLPTCHPARSNPFDADRHWDDHGSPFMRALTEPLRPQPAPKPLPAKLRNVAPGLAGFAEATALLP